MHYVIWSDCNTYFAGIYIGTGSTRNKMSTFLLQRIRPAFASVRSQYTQSQRLYKAGMTRPFSSFLVSPKELHNELGKNDPIKSPKTIPVSAEWFLPGDGRDGRQEFLKLRIPGARFFDLDTIKDPVSPYPHMVPTASVFTEAMKSLGISRDDTVSSVCPTRFVRFLKIGFYIRLSSMTAQPSVSSQHQEQHGLSKSLGTPRCIFSTTSRNGLTKDTQWSLAQRSPSRKLSTQKSNQTTA